jgi:hypothetical protein
METFNYFNYFTEIEEHFWRKRGAHLLVSPLDWAIVETWQKSGIPLAAVLKGIDRAFDSHSRSRRAAGGRTLKSLAYCVDAVLDAATEAQEAGAGAGPSQNGSRATRPASEPFEREEMRNYLMRNAEKLRAARAVRGMDAALAKRFEETAKRLEALAAELNSPAALDLEDFERRLTVLEEKLLPAMQSAASEELLLNIRRELDRQLAPYRRKMSAEQLAQLEWQYKQKRLFESFAAPRLSLFYLT